MVDVDALWKILLAALAGGVGVTAIYGAGLVSATRVSAARAAGRRAAPTDLAVIAGAALVCVLAIIVGFYAITRK